MIRSFLEHILTLCAEQKLYYQREYGTRLRPTLSDGSFEQLASGARLIARKCAAAASGSSMEEVPAGGLCGWNAMVLCNLLAGLGIGCWPAAGTLMWRFRSPKLDILPGATHFSYVWSPDTPLSRLSVSVGMLPEMHGWVIFSQGGVLHLFDASTGTLPAAAEGLGFDWTAELPPDYYIQRLGDAPSHDCRYYGNKAASECLFQYITRIFDDVRVREILEVAVQRLRADSTAAFFKL